MLLLVIKKCLLSGNASMLQAAGVILDGMDGRVRKSVFSQEILIKIPLCEETLPVFGAVSSRWSHSCLLYRVCCHQRELLCVDHRCAVYLRFLLHQPPRTGTASWTSATVRRAADPPRSTTPPSPIRRPTSTRSDASGASPLSRTLENQGHAGELLKPRLGL